MKNALSAQGNRSVFQKLREAALAYHLERKWSKDKILTEYLNTVYFGDGAYGIESAARVLRPRIPTGRRARNCAATGRRRRREAALLAGHDRLARAYDPVREPARTRSSGAISCCNACWSRG